MLANAWRGRRGYLGYLLAATLAVATFLSFGFFLFHPGLAARHLPGLVVQILVAGQLGVAIFAIFFVTFFHRFLLRLRGKEFGLLLALGASHRQLGILVLAESLALGVAAGGRASS